MASFVTSIFTNLDFTENFEVREQALRELEARIREAPVDTRAALATFQPVADAYQRRVIEAAEPTVRILAPAGSGKTQTIINRVIHRVRGGTSPSRILVLTFDNAAATSLKTRLNEQLTDVRSALAGLRILTLNAFGYWVLREYVPSEHKPVIPDRQRYRLLREVRDALKAKSSERSAALSSNLDTGFYLDFFSFLKNELFDPRNVAAQPLADFLLSCRQAGPLFLDPRDQRLVTFAIQAIIWLYMVYEKTMQRDAVLDFDDQKLRAYVSLTENSELLRIVQGLWTEVIVDEFQDINKLDFVFIKALAERATLLVAGDDDQAIYGFRGCTPDYIIDLEQHSRRQVASYELRVNYRCPINIVEHANRLIRHNRRRVEKSPIPYHETPSAIKVASTQSAGGEAKSIVSFIKRVKSATPSLSFAAFAVLYRTNAQSLPLQIEFILNDIPYYVREEDNIVTNEALDKLLGALQVKVADAEARCPAPQDALLAVQSYFRFVNRSAEEQLLQHFRQHQRFRQAIGSPRFLAALPKAKQSQFFPAVEEFFAARTLLASLDVLARRFKGLEGMVGSLEDALEQRVPLAEICEVAAGFRGGIPDFVATIQSAIDRARAAGAGRDAESGVALLTYFKAKGLQWHTVILTTCNEGLIPHIRAPIEDERRLFYVALTRASSNLFVSFVKQSCATKVSASRFLREAGLL